MYAFGERDRDKDSGRDRERRNDWKKLDDLKGRWGGVGGGRGGWGGGGRGREVAQKLQFLCVKFLHHTTFLSWLQEKPQWWMLPSALAASLDFQRRGKPHHISIPTQSTAGWGRPHGRTHRTKRRGSWVNYLRNSFTLWYKIEYYISGFKTVMKNSTLHNYYHFSQNANWCQATLVFWKSPAS